MLDFKAVGARKEKPIEVIKRSSKAFKRVLAFYGILKSTRGIFIHTPGGRTPERVRHLRKEVFNAKQDL